MESDVRVVPLERPATERPVRQRSLLFPVTVGATLVVLGALSALDSAAFDVPAAGYVAAALGVVGIGLIIGTWYGRGRGLGVIGVILALALVPVTAGAGASWDDLPKRALHPHSVSAVERSYSFGANAASLDLSGVEFGGRDVTNTVRTTVKLGAGELVVTVPNLVDVDVTTRVGYGDVVVFGKRIDRFSGSRHIHEYGPDGPGGGELRLDVQVGAGDVVIRRG